MKRSEWEKRVQQLSDDMEFADCLRTGRQPYIEADEPDDDFTLDRLITIEELLENYLPVERTTLWRMRKAQKFPSSVRIGSRPHWRLSVIQKWIHEL
jgi:predicted DNA-binding transcriptional regulator AlpA